MKHAFLLTAAALISAVFASPQETEVDDSDDKFNARAACGNPFPAFGVNQAGAEFKSTGRLPGRVNEDYAWPTQSSVDYFLNLRFNTFRIPFLLERISPSATGGFEYGYLNKLKEVVEYLTGRGAYVILDPHNQMRYQGQLITSTDAFYQWWVRFAAEFRSNPRVAFEVMNAPDGLNATIVAQLNQAAINGIRAANASQLIILEGTNKSTASAWYTSGNADAFRSIRDPSNNFAFGVRQYFNYNNDGNGDDCVSATIGAERIRPFHDWLIINGQKGFLVEYGGGSDSDCVQAIQNTLCLMQQSPNWLGATYWAAGPWWRGSFMSIEPPDGPGIKRILPQALLPFL